MGWKQQPKTETFESLSEGWIKFERIPERYLYGESVAIPHREGLRGTVYHNIAIREEYFRIKSFRLPGLIEAQREYIEFLDAYLSGINTFLAIHRAGPTKEQAAEGERLRQKIKEAEEDGKIDT